MAKTIIMIGPQGSGKGTQAKKLAEHYHLPHISTGDMFREAIKAGTEMGKKAKALMDQGQLVPDDIVCGIVKERLQKPDCEQGFILDGYPRNLPQAEFLDECAEITQVIVLTLPDEVCIERISSRRQCKKCGAIYGKNIVPKKEGICDQCSGELYQRDDDKPEAVKKRLDDYHDKTEPLMEYYRPRDIVHEIDGNQCPEEIFKKVLEIFGE